MADPTPVPPPDADEDPVKQEIERLKRRLEGGMVELRTATGAALDEAEKLARQARGSRPAMRAVTRPRAAAIQSAAAPAAPARDPAAHAERTATPPPGDLTRRFRALR